MKIQESKGIKAHHKIGGLFSFESSRVGYYQ